jgi:hypothetical protein
VPAMPGFCVGFPPCVLAPFFPHVEPQVPIRVYAARTLSESFA